MLKTWTKFIWHLINNGISTSQTVSLWIHGNWESVLWRIFRCWAKMVTEKLGRGARGGGLSWRGFRAFNYSWRQNFFKFAFVLFGWALKLVAENLWKAIIKLLPIIKLHTKWCLVSPKNRRFCVCICVAHSQNRKNNFVTICSRMKKW